MGDHRSTTGPRSRASCSCSTPDAAGAIYRRSSVLAPGTPPGAGYAPGKPPGCGIGCTSWCSTNSPTPSCWTGRGRASTRCRCARKGGRADRAQPSRPGQTRLQVPPTGRPQRAATARAALGSQHPRLQGCSNRCSTPTLRSAATAIVPAGLGAGRKSCTPTRATTTRAAAAICTGEGSRSASRAAGSRTRPSSADTAGSSSAQCPGCCASTGSDCATTAPKPPSDRCSYSRPRSSTCAASCRRASSETRS